MIPPDYETALNALNDQQEGLVLIRGERGIGKTTALRYVAEHSTQPTIWVTINPEEMALPLSGILSITHASNNDELRAFGDRLWDERDTVSYFDAARELRSLLHKFTPYPAVLIIDDIDLIDHLSAQILGALSGRLVGTRISIVASLSPGTEPSPLSHVSMIDLHPLEYANIARIIEPLLSPDFTESTLPAVTMASEGNPATALELLAHNWARMAQGRQFVTLPLRSGPITRARITQQLARLSPLALEVLNYLSTARTVAIGELLQVLPDTEAAIDALTATALVLRLGDDLSLTGYAARSVVYWSIPSETRVEMHAALAAASTPGSAMFVWHSSFGRSSPTSSLDLLDSAITLIDAPLARFPYDLIERAVMLGLPDPEAASRLLVISYALVRRGQFSLAHHYLSLTATMTMSAQERMRSMNLKVQSEHLTRQVLHDTAALEVLAQYGHEDPDEAAALRAYLVLYRTTRWELREAHELAVELREALARGFKEPTGIVLAVLAHLDVFNSDPERVTTPEPARDPVTGSTAGSTATFSAGTERERETLMLRGRYLTYNEQYAEARDIFERLIAFPDPLWAGAARILIAENERQSGNYFGMFEMVKLMMTSNLTPALYRPTRTLLEAEYWREQGDQKKSVQLREELFTRHLGRQNPSLSIRHSAYRGARYLHRGALDVALQLLTPAYAASREVGSPPLTRLDADMVEVLVRVGDLSEAQRVTEELARHMERSTSRWGELALLRCRALVAEGPESITLFDQLLAEITPSDNPYEHARTLTAFAARVESLGNSRRARRLNLTASALYRDLGLPAWADILDAASPPTPTRHPATPEVELTPEETRIADMVVRGMRNYEIATECRMSSRSVEARLTVLYRKLGIRSRGEVSAALRRLQTPPAGTPQKTAD